MLNTVTISRQASGTRLIQNNSSGGDFTAALAAHTQAAPDAPAARSAALPAAAGTSTQTTSSNDPSAPLYLLTGASHLFDLSLASFRGATDVDLIGTDQLGSDTSAGD
jgi:hypothetical protein